MFVEQLPIDNWLNKLNGYVFCSHFFAFLLVIQLVLLIADETALNHARWENAAGDVIENKSYNLIHLFYWLSFFSVCERFIRNFDTKANIEDPLPFNAWLKFFFSQLLLSSSRWAFFIVFKCTNNWWMPFHLIYDYSIRKWSSSCIEIYQTPRSLLNFMLDYRFLIETTASYRKKQQKQCLKVARVMALIL